MIRADPSPIAVLPVVSVVGAAAVLAWRGYQVRRPLTTRSLLGPPFAMSTGFFMFVVPSMRIPWSWGVTAFLLGSTVFASPLVRSSAFERKGGSVLMRRSPWFLLVLWILAAVRVALHEQLGSVLPARQTASLFFVLAFGMVVRWRVWSYLRYRELQTDARGGIP